MKTLSAALLIMILATSIFIDASPAGAICLLTANITAAPTAEPGLPAWTYTIALDLQYQPWTVDQWVLTLDAGSCACFENVRAALTFPSPAGEMTGVPDACHISYGGEVLCGIPGTTLTGTLLAFTPAEGTTCTPGVSGSATFTFFSDFAPAPFTGGFGMVTPSLATCGMGASGLFPAIPCVPAGDAAESWGAVKSLYR